MVTDKDLNALTALLEDRYSFLGLIGEGGMAKVFLAEHKRLECLVAVKVLRESLGCDPILIDRFHAEARTAATLSEHPNIVTIFDIGSEGSLHYMAMQYIRGENLGRYLKRVGALPEAVAAQIASEIAAVLDFAATKRVIHRDLKPSNIRLDTRGSVTVLDFGLAKALDRATDLTRTGERFGTPSYMAPEQFRGAACDFRTDLYALGLIFFEMLTGSRPFAGGSFETLERERLFSSAPCVTDVQRNVSRAYSEIVAQLLQNNPDDRFQTAGDLLKALRVSNCSMKVNGIMPQLDCDMEGESERIAQVAKERSRPATDNRRRGINLTGLTILVLAILLTGLSVYAFKSNFYRFFRPETKRLRLTVSPSQIEVPSTIQDSTGRMFLVPAGSFVYGSNAADSPHKQQTLYLSSFYIDETEVSNATYGDFCKATGRNEQRSTATFPALSEPVVDVSFEDAQSFAAWAHKRLPTEEEWEKSARGTDGRVYPWGNAAMNSIKAIQPVYSLLDRRSPFGPLNMAGNVWEWTKTSFPVTRTELDEMKNLLDTQPVSADWRVLKGGSFSPRQEQFTRCFMRRGWTHNQSSPFIGFRCVKDVAHN